MVELDSLRQLAIEAGVVGIVALTFLLLVVAYIITKRSDAKVDIVRAEMEFKAKEISLEGQQASSKIILNVVELVGDSWRGGLNDVIVDNRKILKLNFDEIREDSRQTSRDFLGAVKSIADEMQSHNEQAGTRYIQLQADVNKVFPSLKRIADTMETLTAQMTTTTESRDSALIQATHAANTTLKQANDLMDKLIRFEELKKPPPPLPPPKTASKIKTLPKDDDDEVEEKIPA